MNCFGPHSFIPDTVCSSEDPLFRDQSTTTGVSPLTLSVVLQGNLKYIHHKYHITNRSQSLVIFMKKNFTYKYCIILL